MEGLTPGRVVHYVLTEGDPVKQHAIGEHRSATVLKVLNADGSANLRVDIDGSNDADNWYVGDAGPPLSFWATSVLPDPDGSPGTWHWIEEV
jgi:hypothetical protein